MSSSSSSVEPVVQLANKYAKEFEEQVHSLRQRSVELKSAAQEKVQELQHQVHELQPLAKAKKEELANVLAEMSPVAGLQTQKLLETFSWIAVLQLTYQLTAGLTSLLLAPLIGLVLDTFPALLLAYGLVPYLAYKHVQQSGDDNQVRYKLLGFAAAEGLLVGFVLSDRYLSTGGPLTFLTPLLIGVVAQLGEGKLNTRQALLGASVGSGLALHLVLGLVSGQLSFGYLLLALLYSGAGFATLQLYIKQQQADANAPVHLYQLGYFLASLTAQALVYVLLGGAHADHKSSLLDSSLLKSSK